ncbi:MAG: neocarzinostatin apoprotein domain-containing protein [Nocardioides sp.]
MKNPLTQALTRPVRALATLAALLVVMVVAAPPSFAAPTLTVSQLTGLSDGQTLTISGSGFEPNLNSIAIGQCVVGYTGPSDCNTAGGATFRNADASGKVASFTITVKEVFGAHDCTKVECMIAAAPIPGQSDAATIAANTVEHMITFASAETATETETDTTTTETTTTDTTTTDTTTETLPQTGAGDSVPVMMLAATALLAVGAGLVLLVPGRRNEVTR